MKEKENVCTKRKDLLDVTRGIRGRMIGVRGGCTFARMRPIAAVG